MALHILYDSNVGKKYLIMSYFKNLKVKVLIGYFIPCLGVFIYFFLL